MDGKKNTVVKLFGIERCEARIDAETARAVEALQVIPEPAFLAELAQRLAHRDH